MAKQLNVSLAFTADTREAKAQLQDLQKQLNNILKTPSNKLGITDEIREAISATAELSSRLQQATNVNTGNLDFSKFNNSLKQSGQSLSSYGQQLQKLGPTGQQAFLTLTKSIATAEIPIKRTNALVKEFATTLANTARWQISSSVLHGLMGSMQSAYRYAQDLNKSLTDIRIVTGQSADQMARFAQQANAAAKQLSASTLEYTNASLIYYQQGLTDQQVKERTDVTVKMANVTRQSAAVVSEQMTAVWNNFYNGSKSLEYYADVMTALGAATASSADEIAGGLEKFAAIGDTIGLSYEYAAAALATITSNTRQSEEVVGTALKTIFARIQGLNLGETLDDGVTLNKYSSALEKVGISIFDSAGELKKMDNILNEMGNKWETLSKAQQTALAQTVAGTRQYTQLVALMDNWNKGDSDSMKANLNTAYDSSGALQNQADIYAESWEAARDRVSAAAEKIYNALLNDDFFIDILNGFEKILGFVDQLIDNLGGLKGIFLALGAIVTKVFSAQISQGLSSMAYNIKMAFPSGRKAIEKERRAFIDDAVDSIPQSNEYTTDVEKAQQDSLRTELTLQMEYMDNAEKMSEIEADTNKKLIERTRILKEHTVELNKRKSSIDDNISNKTMSLRGAIQLENEANPEGNQINYEKQVKPLTDQIKTISSIQAILQDTTNIISAVGQAGEQGSKTMQLFKADLMNINTDNMSAEIKTLIDEINQMGDSPDPILLKEKIEALNFELEKLSQKNIKKIKTFVPKETRDDVDNLTQSFKEQAIVQRELNQANHDSAESYKATVDGIHRAKGAQKQWSDVMVESANVAFNVASAISMVSSAIDTLKDPDVSGMQKLVTVLSTMGMVLPTIISLIGTMKKLFSSETVAKIANAAATWAQVAAEKKYNETKGEGSEVTKKNIKETWQDTVWKSTKKENQDKYIEQVLKDKGYIRDKKTGGWGKTTVGKNGAKRFDASTVISNDDAIKMATPDAQKMAGKSAFKALGSKVANVGIAAAGIAIIIGTVAMVVNQLNKAEKAVEKAKAAAQSLSENYDNVKASYDNFINAQSGYETATDSMKELAKGTAEYQEALLKANEAAGELLTTNKNLKYTVQDGKIVIDEESLEQAKVDELKKVEMAQSAKMAGQQELSKAEMELKKRDAARSMKSGSDGWQKAGNSAAGTVLGAVGAGLAAGGAVGAVTGGGVFSVPAAIIGAVVGGVAGLVTGIVQETSTDTEQDAIEALAKKAEKDADFVARLKAGEVSEEEFKSIGIEDKGLIASLQQNGEQIAELVGEMQANTAAINAQNDLVASNVLSDNEIVQNSEYKDQIIDITGDIYGQAYDKAMESEWVDTWGKDGISKADGANKEAKKVFEEYLKYAGLEGQGYTLKDTKGTDGNRKFVYKDKEGNEKEVSLEAMQAARAAYEASQTLDNSAEKLAKTFDKLAKSANKADKGLLSLLANKDMSEASQEEFKALYSDIANSQGQQGGNISKADVEAYLDQKFGDGEDGKISNETAMAYSGMSAEDWINSIYEDMEGAKESWGSIITPDDLLGIKDADLATAQLADKLYSSLAKKSSDPDIKEKFTAGLNELLKDPDLDEEEIQKVLNILMSADWSDYDALSKVRNDLQSFGIDIDTTSDYWVEYADTVRQAMGATKDYTGELRNLNSIAKVTKDLNVGDSLSVDQFNKLPDEIKKYFLGNEIDEETGAFKSYTFTGNKAVLKEVNQTKIDDAISGALIAKVKTDTGGIKDNGEIESTYAGGSGDDGAFNWNSNNEAKTILKNILINKHGNNVELTGNDSNSISYVLPKDSNKYKNYGEFIFNELKTGDPEGIKKGKIKDNYVVDGFGNAEFSVSKTKGNELVMNYAKGQELERIINDEAFNEEVINSIFNGERSYAGLKRLVEEALAGEADTEELNKVLDTIRTSFDKNDFKEADIEALLNSVSSFSELEQLDVLVNEGIVEQQKYVNAANRLLEEQLKNAQTLDEVERIWSEALNSVSGVDIGEGEDGLDYTKYADALLKLAENYSNCTEEANKFQIAAYSGNEEAKKLAEENLKTAITVGEMAEQYGIDVDTLETQAEIYQELYKEQNLSTKSAASLAAQNQKLNTGVKTLTDNWEDWNEILERGDKTSSEYADTITSLKDVIKDLIGVSDDFEISAAFVEEHLEDIEKAAEGDIEAIRDLGFELAHAATEELTLDEGILSMIAKTEGEDVANNLRNSFSSNLNIVQTGIEAMQEAVKNGTIGVGATWEQLSQVLGEDWASSLNEMAIATGMTKEQMENILRSIDIDTSVQMTKVPMETTVPEYTTTITSDASPLDLFSGGTFSYTSVTKKTNDIPVEGEIEVPQIAMGEDNKPLDITYTGGGSVSTTSTTSSSGGNKSKAKDSHKKKSDAVDRYKEVNDSLEKTNRLMEKNSTLAEGMWGSKKIQAMKKNIDYMKQENDLLEEKLEWANRYLKQDRTDLEATGVGFTFDNDGYITNYTKIMDSLFAEYESKWNEFSGGNEDAELSEEQQEVLDKMWEHIETVKAAYEKYETTLDEVQDLQQEQIEKDLQIQQENFAVLQKELEIKLSINEDDLTTIEYYLSKMSDDFYSMAEAAALMIGDAYSGDENNPFGTHNGRESQGLNYIQQLGNYKKYEEDLEYQYHTTDPETGKTYINKEQYIEGLREVKQGYIDNLQALQELDTAMMSYYADTLAAGQEELSKYTAQMDRHNAVLEHYSSILDIIGKSKDFESMGVVLEAQAHTAENAVKVAEENYNMLRKQADQRKAEYEAELAAKGEDDPGVQMLKKQWLDAEEVVGEAQDDMMQKTEEWAQALKAVVENELEGLARELEKAFTANFGNSFEAMNTQMERAKSLQEEYLTTTNQVYETNKLIRQSQQEIDKTTNSVAKRRLKDFINETEQLQNKNKLSKFELEIQQAKYDLLLAEIALEEAQNAKSTVRLQRDSEGNFGYVYTADQNAIAEAEQKFADAQNSLYNIGLEGANDYTEKYQQTLQEFYDTMTELQTQYLNGEFETEAEYQAAMMEAQEFYYAKLQEYSELYGIAVAVDANIVRDAWSTEFQSMTQSSAQWQAAITTYLAGVEQAFGKWDAYVQQIRDKTIGPNLDALKDKTSAIKTASDEVTTSITKKGGLLDALDSEYTKVAALTLEYSKMKTAIDGVISSYQQYIDDIDAAIQKESGYEDGTGTGTGTGDGSDTSGTNTGSNSGSGSEDSSGSGGNISSQFGSATWERGKAAYDKINAGVWGNGAARVSNGLAAGFTQDEINLGQYMINLVYPTYIKGQGKTWEEAKKLLGFDTGGYTGDWGGSYGKLAMLHKKELVLNAGDTDNFLAGMEMLDNIVKTIDLYSMNAQLGGILSSPSFGFNNRIEPIEQNVHIEAHFPEATDRNEITEAINTLVNQASQFVNRK